METRSKKRKRQRLISIASHVSSWPELPARFESLNDDTLGLILKFVGNRSYGSFGGLNYHCKEIYIASGMTKETFIFGYAPLSVIQERYERDGELDWKLQKALSVGVLSHNRRDILDWALEKQKKRLLKAICNLAGREGRLDLLDEVWNNIEDEKEYIFHDVDEYAARNGKLNVLKWLETKGISINKESCAYGAAGGGQLHIIKWLREEKGLKLDRELYNWAADYGVLRAMEEGNLVILQWLHDEGCPWPEGLFINEQCLNPEVVDWCRANGIYADRIRSSR